jgi:hypothetical protein
MLIVITTWYSSVATCTSAGRGKSRTFSTPQSIGFTSEAVVRFLWIYPRWFIQPHNMHTKLPFSWFIKCHFYIVNYMQFVRFNLCTSQYRKNFFFPAVPNFLVFAVLFSFLISKYALVIMTINTSTLFRSVSLCSRWETLVWELCRHDSEVWCKCSTCLNVRASGETYSKNTLR